MRLSTALLAAIGFAGIVAAAAATETARASGAYASLATPSPAACARACAGDGICMAWSFHRENQCQLSAVVPRARDAEALVSGFAARAPAFLQQQTPAQLAPAPPDATPAFAPEPDDNLLLSGPLEGDVRLSLR